VDLGPGIRWLEAHGAGAAVVPHHDADGLAAGALLARRTGGPVLHTTSPWEEGLPALDAAVVADWGVRPVVGPRDLLYVDHHAEPEQVDGTVVHDEAGGRTSTSLLAWELLGRPDDGAWLATLGAVGDLGDAVLDREDVPRSGSRNAEKRLAGLVTASGRVKDGPVEEAFALLRESGAVGEALVHPHRALLEDVRAVVAEARARALRSAPRIGPQAAVLRFSEPARVHPLVATAWARRLAPRVVVAANDGWRDGRVSFAVRCAAPFDLRSWLRERYEPPAGAGDYARGHAQATGGALVPGAFDDLLEAIL
jgi:single-stranded DNA-specific DHH superfamily exonuclease